MIGTVDEARDVLPEELSSELAKDFELTDEQVQQFQADGYIKLKDVLSPAAVAFYNHTISDLVAGLTDQKDELGLVTYEAAFTQNWNLWRENTAVKALVFSRRLAQIACRLMQVKGVRLYHDQSLFKPAHGDISAWHADQFYWPMQAPQTCTAWIPLQAVPKQMGPLAFSAGSHRIEFGRDRELSDDGERAIGDELHRLNLPYDETPFAVGEISFHAGWTFHRAGRNTSDQVRKVFTIIYMDAEMHLAEPRNKYQTDDWNSWCPGAKIGQVIDTPMNPILTQNTDPGSNGE